jgi:peptide/nickel transport system substrate-binding protein
MFQEIEVAALRKNVNGYVIGPSFDDNRFTGVTKD